MFQFNMEKGLSEDHEFYNPAPTIDDKVHVLVYVFPANVADPSIETFMEKNREIRMAATQLSEESVTSIMSGPSELHRLHLMFLQEFLRWPSSPRSTWPTPNSHEVYTTSSASAPSRTRSVHLHGRFFSAVALLLLQGHLKVIQ